MGRPVRECARGSEQEAARAPHCTHRMPRVSHRHARCGKARNMPRFPRRDAAKWRNLCGRWVPGWDACPMAAMRWWLEPEAQPKRPRNELGPLPCHAEPAPLPHVDPRKRGPQQKLSQGVPCPCIFLGPHRHSELCHARRPSCIPWRQPPRRPTTTDCRQRECENSGASSAKDYAKSQSATRLRACVKDLATSPIPWVDSH